MHHTITRCVTLLAALLFSASLYADSHAPAAMGYGQAYWLSVSDPEKLVDAIDDFRNSAVGKNAAGTVTLTQVVAGGFPGQTHGIGVGFPTAADWDKNWANSAGTREINQLGQRVRSASERIGVGFYSMLQASMKEGAVTSENPVALVYALEVTSPATFMSAFNSTWSKATAIFPGNAYFGEIIAAGENPATHFVSFQANDMATLIDGMNKLRASPEMTAFLAGASAYRRIVSETISIRLREWPAAAAN